MVFCAGGIRPSHSVSPHYGKRVLTDPVGKKVVVITGASSGPGRTIALEFALRGDDLVLASRREHALNGLRRECDRMKARTMSLVTDVFDPRSANALANAALKKFGRVDIWINYAPPSPGPSDGTPSDPYAGSTEFLTSGYVNGANAAFTCLASSGGGVLVNVDSLVGGAAPGYAAVHAEARRRIAATFADIAVRAEQVPGVTVCQIQPTRARIDPEALAPMVVSLAYAHCQTDTTGRLGAAFERMRFRLWERTRINGGRDNRKPKKTV